MDHLKIGNTSFHLASVEGKTKEELLEMFKFVHPAVIEELSKQVSPKAEKKPKLKDK
jgi:hypothetical protein